MSLQPGFFELYPQARPALESGDYLLAADHTLKTVSPSGAQTIDLDASDYHLRIVSPLFDLPPDQLLSTFPPASAVGDWSERLPQVVLKRRTLPWERNPDPAGPGHAGTPDESAPPWLALVVIAEGEGVVSGQVPVGQCVTPGTVMPTDADTAMGRYLEVTEDVLAAVFPARADLSLLCHVRRVSLADTELALNDDDGYLSVVVANRLPQPRPSDDPNAPPVAVKYTACLVNLIGQLHRLPTDPDDDPDDSFHLGHYEFLEVVAPFIDPGYPPDIMVMKGAEVMATQVMQKAAGSSKQTMSTQQGMLKSSAQSTSQQWQLAPATKNAQNEQTISGLKASREYGMTAEVAARLGLITVKKTVRFPVLATWDFVCSGEGTFESLMHGLDVAMLGSVPETLEPALQPEVAATGHVLLGAVTRRGQDTSAWYRGPLVPQPTKRREPHLSHAADQLRTIVTDGREDLGQASAFEIGRLLALSRPEIVAALIAWRRELYGAARAKAWATELLDAAAPGLADAVADKKRWFDTVAFDLVPHLIEQLSTQPVATDFAAVRVPDAIADLDAQQVVAGLGLDAREVRRATKQFGIAGLATLNPQIAPLLDQPVSKDPRRLAGLQADADQRLGDLAAQALRLDDRLPKGGKAPSDDLDRLIRRARERHDDHDNGGMSQ